MSSWPNSAIPRGRIRYDLVCDQGLGHPHTIMEGCAYHVKARSRHESGLTPTKRRCSLTSAPAPLECDIMAAKGVSQVDSTWKTRIRQVRQKRGVGVQLPEHGIRVLHVLKNMGHPVERAFVGRHDLQAANLVHRRVPAPLRNLGRAPMERMIPGRRPGDATFRSTSFSCPSSGP